MSHSTSDAFFKGQIQVKQTKDGYRYSLDAVLLAAAIHPKAGDSVIDLGTGCAIIPLILAYRYPGIRILAVELQDELAALADANVAANHLQDRITVIREDVRRLNADEVAAPGDWVISNPPFYPAGSGRINPNDQKALARHEIWMTLTDLLQAVRRLLRTGGQFAIIYPSDRCVALLSRMHAMGVEPKWLQSIHSRHGDVAKLILVKGVMAGKPGLKIDRPLVVYRSDGTYTEAVQAMMDP
jgi:tRNA1Val (adenine37-N6)-methyltransferase